MLPRRRLPQRRTTRELRRFRATVVTPPRLGTTHSTSSARTSSTAPRSKFAARQRLTTSIASLLTPRAYASGDSVATGVQLGAAGIGFVLTCPAWSTPTSMRSPPRRKMARAAVRLSTAQPCGSNCRWHRRGDADAPRLRLLHRRAATTPLPAARPRQERGPRAGPRPTSGCRCHSTLTRSWKRGTMTLLVVVCSTGSGRAGEGCRLDSRLRPRRDLRSPPADDDRGDEKTGGEESGEG